MDRDRDGAEVQVTGLPGQRRHSEPEGLEKGRCVLSPGAGLNAGGGSRRQERGALPWPGRPYRATS